MIRNHFTALDLTRPTKQTKKSKKRGVAALSQEQLQAKIIEIEAAMNKAAQELDFEKAIELRDQLLRLKSID